MNENLKVIGPGSITEAVDRLTEVEEAVRNAALHNALSAENYLFKGPEVAAAKAAAKADEESTIAFDKDSRGRYAIDFRMATLDHERAFAAIAAIKGFLQTNKTDQTPPGGMKAQ